MQRKCFLKFLTWFLFFLFSNPSYAEALGTPRLPSVSKGYVERIENFQSKFVQARHIDIWLPSDYVSEKKYAVIYMLDGQGLFDASQAWNKQAWNVHLAIDKLTNEKKLQDTIVVGIPNGGKYRYSEYFPEKFLSFLPNENRDEYIQRAQLGKPLADAFLRFLVEEIKPVIDKKYATQDGPDGTYIMGSSMGGLISIYALCEYPHIFGGAAGLSTHWVGKPSSWGTPQKIRNASIPIAAFNYLKLHLPTANSRLVYMDHGTLGIDSIYGNYQSIVDEIGSEIGYDNAHWKSLVFQGARHSEVDWSARLEVPLLFLLGKSKG